MNNGPYNWTGRPGPMPWLTEWATATHTRQGESSPRERRIKITVDEEMIRRIVRQEVADLIQVDVPDTLPDEPEN
jgi:hypothetical protein